MVTYTSEGKGKMPEVLAEIAEKIRTRHTYGTVEKNGQEYEWRIFPS